MRAQAKKEQLFTLEDLEAMPGMGNQAAPGGVFQPLPSSGVPIGQSPHLRNAVPIQNALIH